MTGSPLVTVLTPVWNGERYLAESIESVLAQTFTDWRQVIVDNASTDGTADIAHRYAQRDARISVVRNPARVGVIENHNIAFGHLDDGAAYCKVVHADDWLFPDCLARMVGLAREHPSVGVVSAYRLNGDWVDLDGLPCSAAVMPGPQICRQSLLGGPYVFGSPTSVLFRADLVRRYRPFYEERSIHADEAACYAALRDADFGFVHQVLTFTRSRPESVTAWGRRLDTALAGNLAILARYGPVYLTAGEYARRRAERLREYYRGLVRGAVMRRGPEFWAYHRRALADAGAPLSWWRLSRALAIEAMAAVVGPGPLLRRLGRRWRGDPAARSARWYGPMPTETRSGRLDKAARQLAVARASAAAARGQREADCP